MKRVLVCFALALMMLVPIEASDFFCKKEVINKVESHTAIVVGYFKTPANTYSVRTGAGGVLRDNHIITANHVITNPDLELTQAWVMIKGSNDWVKATVVAQGHSFPAFDDYAILKAEKDLGLPGLSISKKPLHLLQKVLFAGTARGNAYFVRAGYVSFYKYIIKREGDRYIRENEHNWESPVVFISYPGDSGGIITNTNGEIQSIMYWGKYGCAYTGGNPVGKIWDFLKLHNLEHLGETK